MVKDSVYIVSLVSTKSGTGKTTLVEALISLFKERGFSVGALKDDAHRLEIDKQGKDSYRFAEAGADNVIISSSSKLVMIKSVKEKAPIKEIVKLFGNLDIIFIEGFKNSNLPKIEVHRKAVDKELLCKSSSYNSSAIVAAATDELLNVDIPQLDINDPVSIADFIAVNIELFKLDL